MPRYRIRIRIIPHPGMLKNEMTGKGRRSSGTPFNVDFESPYRLRPQIIKAARKVYPGAKKISVIGTVKKAGAGQPLYRATRQPIRAKQRAGKPRISERSGFFGIISNALMRIFGRKNEK